MIAAEQASVLHEAEYYTHKTWNYCNTTKWNGDGG